jgi:hypothetical protein
MRQTLMSIYNHISHKRGADTFMMFLVSTSNTFIVFLRELSAASRTSIGTYIEESPSSALSQMLDRDLQKRKMRIAADDVLQNFLSKGVLQCEPLKIFLMEILSGIVLEMTVEKFSKPDWINSWIVYLLDQETQPEILQKIDIGNAVDSAAMGSEPPSESAERRMSRAEVAMSKAIREAEELTKMIAEEDQRKRQSLSGSNGGSETQGTRVNNDWNDMGAVPEEDTMLPLAQDSSSPFTSFDQIVIPQRQSSIPQEETLHRAHAILSDLTAPTSSTSPYSLVPSAENYLRKMPTSSEYLLQIEPASPLMPGWVVVRKFTDFQTLHEVLRRIAAVSGAESFRKHHAELPTWRGETLDSLRFNLEGYLNDALHERGLADCEGMKRFLEKEATGNNNTVKNGPFSGIKGWPNPQTFAKMGQGALDALSKAPQGVAESGKGLFGGMKKAFTVGGQNRNENDTPKRQSIDPFGELPLEYQPQSRPSSLRGEMAISKMKEYTNQDGHSRAFSMSRESLSYASDSNPLRSSMASRENYIQLEVPPADQSDNASVVSLPPPPSDMPDNFEVINVPQQPSAPISQYVSSRKVSEPLNTQEAQFILDILFSLLSELYTLSSAWTLRRSLLNVAKSILLRPGNASLENLRVSIQETVIDSNTSDEAVAKLIRAIRENVFPTEEERANWEENEVVGGEVLRVRARKLLMAKGVPEALRGMMGAAANEEALGCVFDALQLDGVARGVVGGVVLEGLRGVCQ